MEKIRKIFLLIGSLFFGLGMIWAGSLKVEKNEVAFGYALIGGAVAIIVICYLLVAQAGKK